MITRTDPIAIVVRGAVCCIIIVSCSRVLSCQNIGLCMRAHLHMYTHIYGKSGMASGITVGPQ